MGRRHAGFRKPKQPHFSNNGQQQQGSSGGPADDVRPQSAYNDIVKENDKFVKYYETLNVCPKNEFDEFITSLKTDLPATFRITGSKGEANKMCGIVQTQLIDHKDEEDEAPKIFPIPWYPNKLAWQLKLSRKDIRRCEEYYKLHNFLISETEHGTISRQEAVSMIPPLLLDVQPHHKVLDMCAAPGSKTAQILEMLHDTDEAIPAGYVVANDVDNKRCYMLVHQAKRLNSPCFAVTNHDSAVLPNINRSLPDGTTEQVQFDRILCDVPCSGDGTLRKNPDIWMKWTPANALNLHGIQARIIKRGVELLAVGGRLVYSTCSINPIENEAVIHRILSETNGCLALVDVGDALPGLKHIPGMEEWLVGSRNLEFYETFSQVDAKWLTTIRPQMFPPKLEDRDQFHLNRCMRILPHHQNTGAFFVAVLEKLKPLKLKDDEKKVPLSSPEIDAKIIAEEHEKNVRMKALTTIIHVANPGGDNNNRRGGGGFGGQRKRRRKDVFKEDPFVFFETHEPVWEEIKSFYEISDSFDSRCLLTRCLIGKKKNIYLTSPAVRDLVLMNQKNIKMINTGVKAFVRCDNKNMRCAFRIANDGLESIYPLIGDGRKVNVTRDDLISLLVNDNPLHSPPITTLSDNVQKQTEKLSPGSCILIYKEAIENSTVPFTLYISGWRGVTSLRCYMSQNSIFHLLRLLGGDYSKYDVNKFAKIADKQTDDKNDDVKDDDDSFAVTEDIVKANDDNIPDESTSEH